MPLVSGIQTKSPSSGVDATMLVSSRGPSGVSWSKSMRTGEPDRLFTVCQRMDTGSAFSQSVYRSGKRSSIRRSGSDAGSWVPAP